MSHGQLPIAVMLSGAVAGGLVGAPMGIVGSGIGGVVGFVASVPIARRVTMPY